MGPAFKGSRINSKSPRSFVRLCWMSWIMLFIFSKSSKGLTEYNKTSSGKHLFNVFTDELAPVDARASVWQHNDGSLGHEGQIHVAIYPVGIMHIWWYEYGNSAISLGIFIHEINIFTLLYLKNKIFCIMKFEDHVTFSLLIGTFQVSYSYRH